MDYDKYLRFLYNLVVTDQIVEKEVIGRFVGSEKLSRERIVRKEADLTRAVVPFFLEDGRVFLMDDFPVNFFLSYCVLLGESTKLIEFSLKESGEGVRYVASDKVFGLLQDRVMERSAEYVSPRDFRGKRFVLPFNQLGILKSVKEDSLKRVKVELDKIYVVPIDGVFNFLPSVFAEHLELAKHVGLPLKSFIRNDFFVGSDININDVDSLLKVLNPILVYESCEEWEFDCESRSKVYHDLSYEIYLRPNYKVLCERIRKVGVLDGKSFCEKVRECGEILLSSPQGNIFMPLWKSKESGKFVEIRDRNDFFSLTGIGFRFDAGYLGGLYVQTQEGEEAEFVNYSLLPRIEKFLEDADKDVSVIRFFSASELVVKLMFSEGARRIIEEDLVVLRQIEILESLCRKIANKVISYSVHFNRIPFEREPFTLLEKFYVNRLNEFSEFAEERGSFFSRRDYVGNILSVVREVYRCFSTFRVDEKHLYFVLKFSFLFCGVLKELGSGVGSEVESLLRSYFRRIGGVGEVESFGSDVDRIVLDSVFLHDIFRERRVFVFVKRFFDMSLFPEGVDFLKEEPIYERVRKPNVKKIKEVFPLSWEGVVDRVGRGLGEEVEIYGRGVKLEEDFFLYWHKYKDYKIVCENDFFKLLIRRGRYKKA